MVTSNTKATAPPANNINACTHPIRVHDGAVLGEAADTLLNLRSQDCLIISHDHIKAQFASAVHQALGCQPLWFCVPEGDHNKNMAELEHILDFMAEQALSRDTTLIALGGGMISDITGLAASLYKRGVRWVAIPTTLLAQVDAAIGGKTAVNHAQAKNMISSFYPPKTVINDPQFLMTLPKRYLVCGLAEVVKMALISGDQDLHWLECHRQDIIQRQPFHLAAMIGNACAMKMKLVDRDMTEQAGYRHWLNLGHTFAHALERYYHYQCWLHGEAVAVGVLMALALSQQYLGLDPQGFTRVRALLAYWGLPTQLPMDVAPDALLRLMRYDKKAKQDGINYVLLQQLGQPTLKSCVADELVLAIIESAKEF